MTDGTSDLYATIVRGQRRMYADALINPPPARQSPEGSPRLVRSPPGFRQSLPHDLSRGSSGPPPPVQAGLSPKVKRLPDQEPLKKPSTRRGSGGNQTPDTEGVPLLSYDSSNAWPSAWDGASHGDGQPKRYLPGLPKGRGAGRNPDTEDLLMSFDAPDPQPLAPNSVSRKDKYPPPPPPPLALSKSRDVCQEQGNNGASPVDRKSDIEGVSINPDPPHPQSPARIKTLGKQTPTHSREESTGQGQAHNNRNPPGDRNPDTEGVSINPNSPHPQSPAQSNKPGKQTPVQPRKWGTSQGPGHNRHPRGDQKPETEGVSINTDPPHSQSLAHPQSPVHPQSPAQSDKPGKQTPAQPRGQGTSQVQGHNDPPGDQKPDLEPVSTNSDLPYPQPLAQGDTLGKQPLVQSKVWGAVRGQGRSGNIRGHMTVQKPDSEVVPLDSSDSTRPKDKKPKKDPSKSKNSSSSMSLNSRHQTEQTLEYTKLVSKYTKLSEESEQTTAQFAVRLVELDAVLAEKDSQILELTEAIARLHQRDVEITKDDNYFATQFSDIASSIMQWVLTHFPRNTMVYNADTLPPILSHLVRRSITMEDRHQFSCSRETRLCVIRAVVAELLYRHVFYYSTYQILGSQPATDALQFLARALQGNDFQCQRWRALTISLISKGNNWEINTTEYVRMVSGTIDGILSFLIPEDSDKARRESALRELVDHAARLSVEIRKQSDNIYLERIVPGSPFIPEHMEDMSCLLEDEELVGATVQIQIFPAVLRHCCESDGNLSAVPGVVMKARVIAVNHSLDLLGEGSC